MPDIDIKAAASAPFVPATLEELVKWMTEVFVIPNYTKEDHIFISAGKSEDNKRVSIVIERETAARWVYKNGNLYVIIQTPPLEVMEMEGIVAEQVEAKLVAKAHEYIAGVLSEQSKEHKRPWLLFRYVPDLQKNMHMDTLEFTIILRLRFAIDGMDFPSAGFQIPFDIEPLKKAIAR